MDNKTVVFKFELRAKVRDTLTGFEGAIESRAENLSPPPTYYVVAIGKDKTVPKGCWINEARLELAVTGDETPSN